MRPTDALTLWQEGRALLHPPNRHALNVLSRVRRTVDAVAWLASPTAADTRIEFQRGVRLVALRTPTLLPATHTNAWILGTGELLIVDPGAAEPAEIERLTSHVRTLAAEDCRPLAVVIVAGTVSACLLTLLVLPVMFQQWTGRVTRPAEAQEPELAPDAAPAGS